MLLPSANLVDDGDSGLHGVLVKGFHRVGQVRGCHHVRLGPDALLGNLESRDRNYNEARHHGLLSAQLDKISQEEFSALKFGIRLELDHQVEPV